MLKKIDLYILKSLIVSFFVSFLILSAVMMIGDIIKIYDLVFASGSSIGRVAKIFFYITIFLSIFTIPMALTIATNYTYSELSNNSEITAIRSCGISLTRIYLPAFLFTFLVFLFLVYDMGFIAPRSRFHYRDELIKTFRNKVYVSLKPHVFYTKLGGVLWMDSLSPDHRKLNKVFFSNKNGVFISKMATLKDTYNGILAKFMHVKTYSKDNNTWEFGSFKEYEVSFVLRGANKKPSGIKYMTLSNLMSMYKKSKNRGALYKINKIISLSFSIFSLSLVGFGLGITFSRSGKSTGIVVSLLIFFLMYILIALADSLFKSKGIIWTVYLPTLFILVLGFYIFYKKVKV